MEMACHESSRCLYRLHDTRYKYSRCYLRSLLRIGEYIKLALINIIVLSVDLRIECKQGIDVKMVC